MEYVVRNVKVMVSPGVALTASAAHPELRDEYVHDSSLLQKLQAYARLIEGHHLAPFVPEPFHRNGCSLLKHGRIVERPVGLRVYVEPELPRKTHRTHRPESILSEPVQRRSDGPYQTSPYVILTAERIHQMSVPQVSGNGIDGEIPSGKVLLYGCGIFDAVGMPSVGVASVRPESRCLDFLAKYVYRYRSVGDSRRYDPAENLHDLLRSGVRGDVPVVPLLIPEDIPYGSTHKVCLEAVFRKNLVDLFQFLRYCN